MRPTLLALCGALALLVIQSGAAAPTTPIGLGPTTGGFAITASDGVVCGGTGQLSCSNPSLPPFPSAGTFQARWGAPVPPDTQTGFGYTPNDTPAAALGQNLQLGTLEYVNTAVSGSISQLTLTLHIAASTPTGTGTFDLTIPFAVDQTPNVAPCPYPSDPTKPCSDAVTFQPIAPTTFDAGGETYQLTVLGFTADPNSTTPESRLVVQEEETDTGYLIGNVTRTTNAPPVAQPDSNTVASGDQVTTDVLANDSDPDHDAFAPSITSPPAVGTAVVNADGTITYTAPLAYAGPVSIGYADTDSFGATSPATTLSITVNDTTKPVLSLPSSFSVDETTPAGATVTFPSPPSATDNVDGTDPVTCDHNSGDFFPNGATTVNCSATDAAHNTATGSFTVTVLDITKPVLTLPANITVVATSPSGASVTFSATATDNYLPPTPAVTCDHASGSTFPIGTTTVNCSATDAAGNTATGSFDVTVGNPLDALVLYANGLKPGNSFPAKAQNIRASWLAGDTATACSQLAALVNEAHAQSGKQLTTAQATKLLSLAAAAGAFMGC